MYQNVRGLRSKMNKYLENVLNQEQKLIVITETLKFRYLRHIFSIVDLWYSEKTEALDKHEEVD